MKREEIESKTVSVTITTCDLCGRDNRERVYPKIKSCHICELDVCGKCAVAVDTDCDLTTPHYFSDYPEYICKPCWTRGLEIRKNIMAIRNNAEKEESKLWLEWKKKEGK